MPESNQISIIWSEYIEYRLKLRKFNKILVEKILRFSEERYFDKDTNRFVAIGKDENRLLLIPYEKNEKAYIPITIHAISRQQINYRIKIGRFKYE